VAPPFIPVPPPRYGGTELFLAHLARGLVARGHHVVLYANGESKPPRGAQLRSLYPSSDWPLSGPSDGAVKELEHAAWACGDAAEWADVVHVNGISGVVLSRFLPIPVVATLHHSREAEISEVYGRHDDVTYVGISRAQLDKESLPRSLVVHHGIDLEDYPLGLRRDDDLVFLGRMTPEKAPHLAIDAARLAGRRLKLAGEIQPMYRDYWERMVEPRVDGAMVEYVGEADLATKTDLLGRAAAMLFPIQWDEPFGLVMIEAMACGTPVLAFGRGSVPEVVENGVSGWVCDSLEEMARRAAEPGISPLACRRHVASRFSIERMAAGYERAYRRALATAAQRSREHSPAAVPIVATPKPARARPNARPPLQA
jgi:glycosyltransferase involved in cell wall biosynthesis